MSRCTGMALASATPVVAANVRAAKPAFSGLSRHGALVKSTRPNAEFSSIIKGLRPSKRSATALQSTSAMEIFQLAGEGGEIAGTAAIMFAITLVGLAFGFVLIRVESLVEEGKL